MPYRPILAAALLAGCVVIEVEPPPPVPLDAGAPGADSGPPPGPCSGQRCYVHAPPFTCSPCSPTYFDDHGVTWNWPDVCLQECGDRLRRSGNGGNACIYSVCQGVEAECVTAGGTLTVNGCSFGSYVGAYLATCDCR